MKACKQYYAEKKNIWGFKLYGSSNCNIICDIVWKLCCVIVTAVFLGNSCDYAGKVTIVIIVSNVVCNVAYGV